MKNVVWHWMHLSCTCISTIPYILKWNLPGYCTATRFGVVDGFSTFLNNSSICTGDCGICPKLWTSNLLKQDVRTVSGCLVHASSASCFINSLSDFSGEVSPCGKVGVDFVNNFCFIEVFFLYILVLPCRDWNFGNTTCPTDINLNTSQYPEHTQVLKVQCWSKNMIASEVV